MRLFAIALLTLGAVVYATAQKPDDVLATVNGQPIKFKDLSDDTQKIVADVPARTAKFRSDLLGQMMNERAVQAEAKAVGSTPGRLVAAEKAKIPAPSEADIQAVINANQAALAGTPSEEARKQVIAYLRSEPEQKALVTYLAAMSAKYKAASGKDINSNLLGTDVVATVAGQPITDKEFEDYARLQLWGAKADIADLIGDELNQMIFQKLIDAEAASQKIDASELIAREITNKQKEFTDDERLDLSDALAKKLSAKYKVVVTFKRPDPIVENISLGTSPAQGPSTAPVTVVMFSDFQCPACSATHPILKKVLDQYPGKIRFVVRDFPLQELHEKAYQAALAAEAANKQGKFFEYIDILYKNQSALDDASLAKYAAQLGLNAAQFELDFKSDATAAQVKKDIADGESYHITGTPTIFINGVRMRTLSAEAFKAVIDRALAK
ncbi:MAG: thioredoxin domain-containing protein [Acidobacteria bacterium]|nr:thioredoxin domain-containing protein [Acidobacteriota bacterium]